MPEPVDCPHACGHKIPTVYSFEPEIGAFGQTVMRSKVSVSQDDLRRHLLDHHGPKRGFRQRMIR